MTSKIWTSDRDIIIVQGPEAESYLHSQISQNVDDMSGGESRISFLLEPKGNIEGYFRITKTQEGQFVLDTESGFGSPLISSLERFKLRTKADFELHEWEMVSVFGEWSPADLGPQVVFATSPWLSETVIDVLGAAVEIDLPTCAQEEYERIRFECGLPTIGRELQVGGIPNESGLVERAVSFDKGCYRGQELVERISARGGGRHKIRRICSDESLLLGQTLFVSSERVGEVLTVTNNAPYVGFASLSGEDSEVATDDGAKVSVVSLEAVL
tara:strand:+ start:24615 stop:25427 length:813 start_codon:yes stop_codon:yes gene_type:complete